MSDRFEIQSFTHEGAIEQVKRALKQFVTANEGFMKLYADYVRPAIETIDAVVEKTELPETGEDPLAAGLVAAISARYCTWMIMDSIAETEKPPASIVRHLKSLGVDTSHYDKKKEKEQ